MPIVDKIPHSRPYGMNNKKVNMYMFIYEHKNSENP